jgi:hypothetical protein
MRTSVQHGFGPMELERVGTASPTLPNSVGDWRLLVARALGRAGISQKAAAADLGLTPQALSRQLAGMEHLSFWRMYALSPEFWRELVALICEFHDIAIGQTVQDRTDAEIGRLVREAVTKAVAR